jgi:hypothetical protein
MLEICLERTPPGRIVVSESRETFLFSDRGGRVHNPAHRHRIVAFEGGQLRMLAQPAVVGAAIPNGDVQVEEPLALGDHILVDGAEYVIKAEPLNDPHLEEVKTYRRYQVMDVVNAAFDLVTGDDQITPGERETDLIALVVNTINTLFEKPDADLNEVMDRHYEGGAAKVREWWGGWS